MRGDIIFKNIIFSYPSRPQHIILNSLYLILPSGTTTAVVGASGSGKSTLAALLLRLYDPESGEVLLDKTPVRDYDPVWLRKNIGIVSQVSSIFFYFIFFFFFVISLYNIKLFLCW